MTRAQRQLSPFRDILQNRTDGASALFYQFLDRAKSQSEEKILAGLTACQQTFPMMAVWSNALALFKQSNYALDTIARQFRQHTTETISTGSRVLREYGEVLTLSNSSVVRQAITSVHSSIKVLCAESLPGGEGADQVNALRLSGVESVLVKDNDLPKRVTDVEAVVLGADQWNRSGFINKVGSKNVIEYAEIAGIPVFILAEEFKRVVQIPNLETDPYEIAGTSDRKTTQEMVFELITWRPHIKLISNTKVFLPTMF